MLEKIKNKVSRTMVLGISGNFFYRYLYLKIFLRNRYVLVLVFMVFILILINWLLWTIRIANTGFAIESTYNFLLNLPFIPRFYSLLFIDSFLSLVNLFLAYMIYKKSNFAGYVLIFSAIFINLLVLALTIYYIVNFSL